MRKPTVFVSHDTQSFNTFPAKRHGNVTVCVEGHVGANDYDVAVEELREVMSQAQSGDLLLPIGSPVLIAAAAVELVKRTGTLTVLTWDRRTESYHPITVGSLQ